MIRETGRKSTAGRGVSRRFREDVVASQQSNENMEALGRVELPTNGLGNVGQGPPLNWLNQLLRGFPVLSWGESSQSAVICQRICQRNPRPTRPPGHTPGRPRLGFRVPIARTDALNFHFRHHLCNGDLSSIRERCLTFLVLTTIRSGPMWCATGPLSEQRPLELDVYRDV